MKKIITFFLQTMANILILLVLVLILFRSFAALRETQTRHAAAPTTGRFVQAGDVEMFIQEMEPQGTPRGTILFIHGTAAWSGLWRETMTRFAAAGYRCIAVDIPPFGFSQRPPSPSYGNADQARRLVALIDALGLEHVILFGHSFGGGATVETAMLIPEKVDMLVLEDAGNLNLPNASIPPAHPAVAFLLRTPFLRDPVVATTGTNPLFTRTLISGMVLDPKDLTDEKIGILQQPMVLNGATNTLGDWLASVLLDQKPSLTSDPANYQKLTMPTLILWGDSDTVVPLREGQYLQSLIPGSQLTLLPGVNHIPHLEDLDAVEKMVLAFFAEK